MVRDGEGWPRHILFRFLFASLRPGDVICLPRRRVRSLGSRSPVFLLLVRRAREQGEACALENGRLDFAFVDCDSMEAGTH